MDIRPAEPRDIPRLLELLRQVCNVHQAIRPDIFRPDAVKYDGPALEALLRDPARPIFAAAEQDRVLGYCFCKLRDCQSESGVSTERRELYVDDLCVDESHRSRGIATALYHHVTAYARSLGCQFITLNVWCGNDSAMRFYEKRGLRPRHIMLEMPLEEEYADQKSNL